MNELFLYDYIKTLINASTTFEGRFFVAEGYGNDLNSNNFNEVLTDVLGSYMPKGFKYPCTFILPPTEVVGNYDLGWSRFKIDQFFVTTTGYEKSEIKGLNKDTNTSTVNVISDWNQMRVAAGDYRRIFKQTLKDQNLLMSIRPVSQDDYIKRVTNMNNDRVSGVVVTYYVDLYMGVCETGDYDLEIAPWPTPYTGARGNARIVQTITNNDLITNTIVSFNFEAYTDYVFIAEGVGNIEFLMPKATEFKNMFTLKKVGTGQLSITFQPGETGDGSSIINLPVQYQSIDLISNQLNNYNVI